MKIHLHCPKAVSTYSVDANLWEISAILWEISLQLLLSVSVVNQLVVMIKNAV
jgi:hypothetical protein